jgi:hypothetical protein
LICKNSVPAVAMRMIVKVDAARSKAPLLMRSSCGQLVEAGGQSGLGSS